MTDKEWQEKCNLYIKIHDAVVIDNEKLYELNVKLVKALELCSKTSYIRDAHSIAIKALDHLAGVRKKVCTRCGEVNPAEIHTCTPLDPLLESGCGECGKKASDGWALYCVECSAPMREWVGLTDEEAAQCWNTSAVQTWKAIEAKLKEKNTL